MVRGEIEAALQNFYLVLYHVSQIIIDVINFDTPKRNCHNYDKEYKI